MKRSRIPLALLMQLGLRNLVRYRRRNGMLCVAVAVCVASLVFAAAFLRGWQYDMRHDAVSNLNGHIKVIAPGFLEDPSAQNGFHIPEGMADGLDAASLKWTSRLMLPAVIASERETRGVQIVGVDPVLEQHMSFYGDLAIRGRALEDRRDRGLLLGKELARRLNTDVGRRVVVMLTDAKGESREAGLPVVGVYDAEGIGLELQFAFVGREFIQSLLRDPMLVTEVSLLLTDESEQAGWQAALIDQQPNLEVKSWQELVPQLAQMLALSDGAIWIWFGVFLVALAFGVANTLIAAVMERVRELGLMHVLGMRRGALVAQVVVESLWIVGIGVVLGVALGVSVVYVLRDGIALGQFGEGVEMFSMHSVMMLRLTLDDVLLASGVTLLLGVLGSLYPAWRAVRLNPLEALHGGKR